MTKLELLGLALSDAYTAAGVPWPNAVREAWDAAMDAEDAIPMVVRPTGRTIPDLRWREHACNYQQTVHAMVALPALSVADIVAIRDRHLPSQGEAFDCVAFARDVVRATHKVMQTLGSE